MYISIFSMSNVLIRYRLLIDQKVCCGSFGYWQVNSAFCHYNYETENADGIS
uniref:Uncharacterized protein n=1 Tax=Anguilla anguilla TaxID=7936 RepID=A0A0E9W922_ANGAN